VSLFLFQPSSAPGREGGPGPAQTSPSGEGQDGGPPAGPPPDGGILSGPGMTMLLPLLLFVGFMLWSSRNQQKKQKQIEEGIKVGERVLTTSGIVGKVTEVGERTARLEVAPGVHVTFIKSAIQGTDPTVKKDETKDAATRSSAAKDAPSKDDKAKDESKKDK